jgi:hypothetical protein
VSVKGAVKKGESSSSLRIRRRAEKDDDEDEEYCESVGEGVGGS